MKLGRGRTEQQPKSGSPTRVGRAGQSAYRQVHRGIGRQLGAWQDTVQAIDYYSQTEQNNKAAIARQLRAGD